MRTKAPAWMRSLDRLPGRWSGARGDEIFEGDESAVKIWGEAAEAPNSSACAFAYLWRRFGPPPLGSDDYKDLCRYDLGTPSEDVVLFVCPVGSPIVCGVGYLLRVGAPRQKKAVNAALAAAMTELLRPVFVRDMAMNICGVMSDEDAFKVNEAPYFKHAGLGCQVRPEAIAAERARRG